MKDQLLIDAVVGEARERIGSRLDGKYDLLRVCGQGGMGVVFEGVNTWTGRRVAVKVLHSTGGSDEQHLARLLREARTATSLRHPNVVDILDMGRDGATPFIVMEYLEGESLDALLAREGRLSRDQTLGLLLPVLAALATAHDLGIVHRDIKPANIFLSVDSAGTVVPKLLDFGIAQSESQEPTTTADRVTGTPAYMSPEHARGKGVGPSADVWAMGVVIYRCLAGVLPFGGTTPGEVLAEIFDGRKGQLNLERPDLPARFSATIERALSAAPEGRYSDMRTFGRAILATAGAIALPPGLSLSTFQETGSKATTAKAPAADDVGPGEATETYQSSPAFDDSQSRMVFSQGPLTAPGRARPGAYLLLGALLLGGALVGPHLSADDEETASNAHAQHASLAASPPPPVSDREVALIPSATAVTNRPSAPAAEPSPAPPPSGVVPARKVQSARKSNVQGGVEPGVPAMPRIRREW